MTGQIEEDEKNEKIIRSLLKLPENRCCINCNSLGPQYVCTNFWTFVCATCSGIHREFTHRVKSISMATFTAEDVSGLRGGGNKRAKEVYFKKWDLERQSFSDNRNIEGLRKFIKHVYVDRRYTGEKSNVDGPSTPKKVEREDSFTHRSGLHRMLRSDIHEQRSIERSGSSGKSDERNSGKSFAERRNQGKGKESRKHVDRKRISAYFEVVDDRFRDDESEPTKPEGNWVSNRTYNLQRSPSNQHIALDSSRPREVRSLRDILDKIPSLRPSEAVKDDGGRPSDGSVHMQKTASIKTRQTDAYSMEPRTLHSMGYGNNTLGSPDNISSDPEPASKQSPKSSNQSISKPTSSPYSNSFMSIDCPAQRTQSKAAASNAKNLDSVVPAAKPVDSVLKKPCTGSVHAVEIANTPRTPSSSGVSPAASLSSVLTSSPTSTFPSPKPSVVSAASLLTSCHGGYSREANHVKQGKGILAHPQCSIFQAAASQSTSPVPSSSPTMQSSHFVPQHIPQATAGVVMGSLPSVHKLSEKKEFQKGHGTGPAVIPDSGLPEQKSVGRKELPQHLFVTTHSSAAPVQSPGWQALQTHVMGHGLQYSSAPAQSPGWQSLQAHVMGHGLQHSSAPEWQALQAHVMGNGLQYSSAPAKSPGWQSLQAHVMGHGLQYPSTVQVPTVYQPANTFDLNNGAHPQSPMSSSMASWQGSQPNVSASPNLLQSSSLDSPSVQWLPAQSSPYRTLPFQPLSSTSGMASSSYMGQQLPNKPPPAGCQGVEVMGNNLAVFSTSNSSQQPGGQFSSPVIQRSLGNPFA